MSSTTIHYEPVYTHPQNSSSTALSEPESNSGLRTILAEDTSTQNENQLPPKRPKKTKHKQWRRCALQTFVGIGFLILFTLVFIIFYIFLGMGEFPKCNAGSIFEPTILYGGKLTNGQAKAIDIAYNTVVGRGGQAIVAYTSYRVVTGALMRVVERTPITFDLFVALAFNHSNVWTIWPTLRSTFSLRGARSKWVMMWLLYSSLFLLVLPSLMDATTGYTRNQDYTRVFDDGSTMSYWAAFNSTKDTRNYQVVCQPAVEDRYQWGFVSWWIVFTLALFGVWLLGTYAVWADMQQHSQLIRKGRTMGPYRAILDIADAAKSVLGPHTDGYSGSELQKELSKTPWVQYEVVQNETTGQTSIKLVPRLPQDAKRMGKLAWDVEYTAQEQIS